MEKQKKLFWVSFSTGAAHQKHTLVQTQQTTFQAKLFPLLSCCEEEGSPYPFLPDPFRKRFQGLKGLRDCVVEHRQAS
jgi:hypothetical protein